MKLITAGMEVKGYSYAIFQFNNGAQIGLSLGLGVVVTGIAILMGRGFESLCFVDENGDALSLNCCKIGRICYVDVDVCCGFFGIKGNNDRAGVSGDSGGGGGGGGGKGYAIDEQQIALTGVMGAEESI